MVPSIVHAILRLQFIRATGIAASAFQHAGDIARLPGLCQQFFLRFSGAGRGFNEGDDRIDIAQRNRQTFQNMPALTRFPQQVDRAAGNHFAAMSDKGFEYLFQVQQFGPAVDQRHHIDPEY